MHSFHGLVERLISPKRTDHSCEDMKTEFFANNFGPTAMFLKTPYCLRDATYDSNFLTSEIKINE